MVHDPLTVYLTASEYPKSLRLTVPDMFKTMEFGQREEAWAILGIPAEKLMRELNKPRHQETGYPNREKIVAFENKLKKGQLLQAPVLEIFDNSSMPEFSFFDGRHRIAVLAALGAAVIPVTVSWHRADDFISYFS